MMAPGISLAIITAIAISPTIAQKAPEDIGSIAPVSPRLTRVALSPRTHPISLRPIIARNMPIPAPVAIFRSVGMALIIAVLQPTCGRDRMRNRTPSTSTAASAICQLTAVANHGAATVNAKYAFRPIPGANAKGSFAHSPMTMHPTNAATAVANRASSNGIPVTDSIDGFTSRM